MRFYEIQYIHVQGQKLSSLQDQFPLSKGKKTTNFVQRGPVNDPLGIGIPKNRLTSIFIKSYKNMAEKKRVFFSAPTSQPKVTQGHFKK